jgi:hypothetical protein
MRLYKKYQYFSHLETAKESFSGGRADDSPLARCFKK